MDALLLHETVPDRSSRLRVTGPYRPTPKHLRTIPLLLSTSRASFQDRRVRTERTGENGATVADNASDVVRTDGDQGGSCMLPSWEAKH